jgi:hypothetical protein
MVPAPQMPIAELRRLMARTHSNGIYEGKTQPFVANGDGIAAGEPLNALIKTPPYARRGAFTQRRPHWRRRIQPHG